MKIDVRFRGIDPSPALEDFTLRRLHERLSRFGREVSSVVVRIADVNGPRGGVDKHCSIELRGPRFGTSRIRELHDDAYGAVGRAIERIAHRVGRQLERSRRIRRDAPLDLVT